jgi:transcriptional regulator with XRE-family HTH domain
VKRSRLTVEHRREIRKRVAAEIRKARNAAGLTQVEFAARMKKSQRWASVTENAKGSVWIHELPDIAKALGIDPSELLRRATRNA